MLIKKSNFWPLQNYIFSIESDWSDDEREELEKLFGVMSEKGEEYTKLRQLRRSRQLNIIKNIKGFVMKEIESLMHKLKISNPYIFAT